MVPAALGRKCRRRACSMLGYSRRLRGGVRGFGSGAAAFGGLIRIERCEVAGEPIAGKSIGSPKECV